MATTVHLLAETSRLVKRIRIPLTFGMPCIAWSEAVRRADVRIHVRPLRRRMGQPGRPPGGQSTADRGRRAPLPGRPRSRGPGNSRRSAPRPGVPQRVRRRPGSRFGTAGAPPGRRHRSPAIAPGPDRRPWQRQLGEPGPRARAGHVVTATDRYATSPSRSRLLRVKRRRVLTEASGMCGQPPRPARPAGPAGRSPGPRPGR